MSRSLSFLRLMMAVMLAASLTNVHAQATSGRLYRDQVFASTRVEKNISYLGDHQTDRKKKYYKLDLYTAVEDSVRLRPLIIWIHGGGFKFGNKRSRGSPLWAKNFARRGYVCASINYRLSRNNTLFDFTDLAAACVDAIADTRLAISFLKQHAAQYGIDTSVIILAGNSAGGITALHEVYASDRELARLAGKADSSSASSLHNPNNIRGIINFWGAVFDTSWLGNAIVPIVSAHGTGDRVVAFSKREAPLFGSELIHREADQHKIPNKLKAYKGYGHELQKHFNPIFVGGSTKKRWRAISDFAAEFLYEEVIRNLKI